MDSNCCHDFFDQVNVPCTKDGLKAAKDLVKAKIRVTMTDLSSVHQVHSS
jgi:transaldolase